MASEPIENASSATDTLTEDELLGTATETDLTLDPEALDEEALLGLDNDRRSSSVGETQEEETTTVAGEGSAIDNTSDHEELDYDDDDDHEEKEERSKFTSERSKPVTKSSSSFTASVSSTSATSSSGFNFRGRNNNYNNNRPKPPSLLGMQLPPPAFARGKILVNPNFIPQPAPLVRLNMPGAPPIAMRTPSMPAAAFMPGPGGQIVPRLPNGIPLLGLPPNHGVAGFGGPPPRHQPMMPHPGMIMARAPNWDQAVNAFLNGSGPLPKRTRRRSSSYSSYSSYSSRSNSRSPRRKRAGNGKERKRSGDRRRDERPRGGERRPPTSDSSRSGRSYDRRERRRDDKVSSEDCAKAVGVDNDYLSRIEEQKRRREEVVRRKEQRRHGGEYVKPEATRERKHSTHEKKAYLVVVIKNMKHLPTAQEKIKKLAGEVGSITKCWRFNDDSIYLIFADHTDAKTFLTKFNGKVLSGLKMQVNVEKAYLNLSEVEE